MGGDSHNINIVALTFLLVLSGVVLQARRQVAVKALLAVAAFLPLGQQIVVAGLHFTFLRILILIGFCRLVSRGEAKALCWQTVDKLFLAWAVTGFVCGMIRSPSAEIAGMFYDSVGVYFLVRCLTAEGIDAVEHLKFLACAMIVIGAAMAVEYVTHRDLFHVFGGVPDVVAERDGRFRCQGPFRHPILAGTFAATQFPLMLGLWFYGGRTRKLALTGLIACVFCAYAAASSGALITLLACIIGFSVWKMRFHMRLVRRVMGASVLGLALVMNAPIWFLIAKLGDITGGTGWHRSYLIEQAYRHFNEWWLIGSSYTAHWAPSGEVLVVDPNNMDITNHYIAQGLQGGALRLGLFLAIIVACYKIIGRTVVSLWNNVGEARLWWACGVCLTGHCAAFISISYYDQTQVFLFWLWAVIAAIPVTKRAIAMEEAPSPADDPQSAQTAGA